MTSETSYGAQSFPAAVDVHGGCTLLKALGKHAEAALVSAGCNPADIGFDEDDHPSGHGLYVWEGWYLVQAWGTSDSWSGPAETSSVEESWDGDWRPATADDLRRFGFAAPESRP